MMLNGINRRIAGGESKSKMMAMTQNEIKSIIHRKIKIKSSKRMPTVQVQTLLRTTDHKTKAKPATTSMTLKPVRLERPAPCALLLEGLEVGAEGRVCVPLDATEDKTEVENPEVEGVGLVLDVDRVTREIDGDVGVEVGDADEVERVPTVTVDNTSLGLLLFTTTDEGTGMEAVATGSGSANDPVILSRRKKGEKAA